MSFKTIGVVIDGISTDIVISEFRDSIFIALTQYQELGAFISVKKDILKDIEGEKVVYNLKTLFGEEDENSSFVARFLAEQINIPKPAIFSICLKNKDIPTVRAIREVLLREKMW